jgi:signal transduction histidine kinase/CheY-like chemotaxis protein
VDADRSVVNILLVDDEPRNLTALEAVLDADDRNLVAVGSGREALRELLHKDFAVILLDVRMPELDGFETAELIRQRDRTRDTPIIFLTADTGSAGLAYRGYSVGAVDYILKPFDPDVLRSKVAVFVELFRKTAQVRRQAEQLAQLNLRLAHRSVWLEAKLDVLAGVAEMLQGSAEGASLVDELLRRCLEASGVPHAAAYLLEEDGRLVRRASVGYVGAESGSDGLGGLEVLLREAIESGAPIGLPSPRFSADDAAELLARTDARSLVVAPLTLRGERLGALVLASHDIGVEEDQAAFARVVGGQASQAVVLGRTLAERAELLAREQLAHADAQEARRRFAFLAEVSGELATSLDAEANLPAVAHLAVPVVADACLIDLVADDGPIRCAAIALSDRRKLKQVEKRLREPRERTTSTHVARALSTGRPHLLEEIDPNDSGLVLAAVGAQSALIAPLVARGRTFGAVTLVFAGSGRRYREADLTLGEDLARRIALAIDNARLYEEARASVRVRDEFFATASHDLRTPLTVIKGQTQILQRRAKRAESLPSDSVVGVLGRIESAVSRMAAQVEELLDVARVQMGQPLDLELKRVDLVELARQSVAELPSGDGHSVVVEVGEPHLVGRWDERRLERVLNNLLENAVKYSPNGGEVRVSLAPGPGGEQAILRVRDEGIGIPAADLPRVFDRFHRARNVIGLIAGTGIGLAGVRQIVEQHNGTVAIESTEGAGTTVTVRLPLGAEAGGERPESAMPRALVSG